VQLRKVLLPQSKPAPKPEIEGPANAATIWLNSPLPDPTPPAVRLSPKFAANLKKAAKSGGVDWATMLGILRARGATGHIPADRVTLNRLASRLDSFGPSRGDWSRVVAYSGDSRFADKATALARYDRAVGLDALVNGLEASKATIASRILSDPSISIYQGGRSDIVSNKIDVRVLAMIAYLRESFGLGHGVVPAQPVTACTHGPASSRPTSTAGRSTSPPVGGVPIQGHQQPGGITERTVREILSAAAGGHAAAGHLTARPRRTVVPAGRSLQPHPHRVLVATVALRREDGTIVCERCLLAETALTRMRGLFGPAQPADGRRDPVEAGLVGAHGVHALRDRRGVSRSGHARRQDRRGPEALARGGCARVEVGAGDRGGRSGAARAQRW
jgi:hypothetical protein